MYCLANIVPGDEIKKGKRADISGGKKERKETTWKTGAEMVR